MASEIRVPRLGWSMEEGVFLGWRKRDGEQVATGEILFELEGEKASQEIEALDAGVLRIAPDAPAAGSVVPVGALLGYLARPDEAVTFGSVETVREHPVPVPPAIAVPAAPPPLVPPTSRPKAPPSVRRLARELGVSLDELAPHAPAGRVTGEHVRQAAQQRLSVPATPTHGERRVRQRATPRARRVARELGVSWQGLAGSGLHGRVREQDIFHAAARTAGHRDATPVAAAQHAPTSRHRRSIADRMLASQRETAPVTLTSRADATNLVSLRAQFKAAAGTAVIPSYTDIIAKLVGLVLRQHLALAGQWRHDHIELPSAEDFGIGVAVDTAQGLVVPVLRRVVQTPLLGLAEQSRELVTRARAGQLRQADLEGGVFTITNLGSYGIDAFTPIINYPECAILGLGAIRREPICGADGQVIARERMTLSLTFDHRLVDGAPAARFLQAVCGALENPSAWLLL